MFNGVAWSAVTPFVAKQKDSFYKITFSDGSELKANSDHEFQIERNSTKVFRLKTGELKVGDKLPKFELPTTDGVLDENAYTLGAFTGDGYVDNGTCLIYVPESKYGLIPHLKHESVYKEQHREGLESHVRVRTSINAELGVQLRDREQGLPAFIMNYDKLSALAFIAGVIDTDGTLGKTGTAECYKIYGTSPKKLRDIQILARRAGINSVGVSFHTSKEKKSALCGRNFDLYVLHIASHACVEIPTKLKVATSFGKRFKPHPAFPDIIIDTASRVSVRSVEKLEIEEPSYCFSEPFRGMGVFNNVLTYQCNLATVFLPNIKSLEEFKDVATLLYRVNKHSLQLKAHHPETDAVVKKNQRMGISLTGILQCTDEQLGWCDAVYEHLRAFDLRYSMLHGFRPSIKLTTIQPSGTLSLLPGVLPGIHPGYAQYMYRRIRIASGHPLVNLCRDHGYPVEFQKSLDGKDDYNTVVVTFPLAYPEGAKLNSQMSAIDQLKAIKKMQTIWSDNSVSCTVYYKLSELPAIREYLEKNYEHGHKTLSFLLHSGHGFVQAPYEEITKEAYEELVAKTKLITSIGSAEFDGAEECANGACPVR